MNPTRTIWVVIGGAGLLTGWRAIRTGTDPIPQWAGIGAAGVMLLFLAEFAPKFASGFSVLLGITFALNYQPIAAGTSAGTGWVTGAGEPFDMEEWQRRMNELDETTPEVNAGTGGRKR